MTQYEVRRDVQSEGEATAFAFDYSTFDVGPVQNHTIFYQDTRKFTFQYESSMEMGVRHARSSWSVSSRSRGRGRCADNDGARSHRYKQLRLKQPYVCQQSCPRGSPGCSRGAGMLPTKVSGHGRSTSRVIGSEFLLLSVTLPTVHEMLLQSARDTPRLRSVRRSAVNTDSLVTL